jgi:hypothetical protein
MLHHAMKAIADNNPAVNLTGAEAQHTMQQPRVPKRLPLERTTVGPCLAPLTPLGLFDGAANRTYSRSFTSATVYPMLKTPSPALWPLTVKYKQGTSRMRVTIHSTRKTSCLFQESIKP